MYGIKSRFYCDNCKKYFYQHPSRLINEKIYGCYCSHTRKKTNEDFLQELGSECLNNYIILDEYINTDTKIRIQHKLCNTVFKTTPYNFIYFHKKNYCPYCAKKQSQGELAIMNFLQNHQIEYYKEYIFKDFSNRRFDFYLPKENIIIEYDGQQHFEALSFFGGQQGLEKLQLHDQEKNNYCLKNNIILYRISYIYFNDIENILNKILIEKCSTTIEKFKITEQSR